MDVTFIPACGDGPPLPFRISVATPTKFRDVIQEAIFRISNGDETFLENKFDISTSSADIPLEIQDFDSKVSAIITKYGTAAFCIRIGDTFEYGKNQV